MLVLVLYLIKFGCATITYISNNLIAKMKYQPDFSEAKESNFNDKSDKVNVSLYFEMFRVVFVESTSLPVHFKTSCISDFHIF